MLRVPVAGFVCSDSIALVCRTARGDMKVRPATLPAPGRPLPRSTVQRSIVRQKSIDPTSVPDCSATCIFVIITFTTFDVTKLFSSSSLTLSMSP